MGRKILGGKDRYTSSEGKREVCQFKEGAHVRVEGRYRCLGGNGEGYKFKGRFS